MHRGRYPGISTLVLRYRYQIWWCPPCKYGWSWSWSCHPPPADLLTGHPLCLPWHITPLALYRTLQYRPQLSMEPFTRSPANATRHSETYLTPTSAAVVGGGTTPANQTVAVLYPSDHSGNYEPIRTLCTLCCDPGCFWGPNKQKSRPIR